MRRHISRRRRAIFCLALAAFFVTSAVASVAGATMQVMRFSSGSAARQGAASRDYWPTRGWQYTSPERQGMDSASLDDAVLFLDNYPTDSFIVVRHGYIVCEEYLHGGYYAILHHTQSAAKSIASILIGIAIDKGFIKNVSQKVIDFFPNWQIANLDSYKRNMTLWHLLTMTTGLAWDEWTYPYTDTRNSCGAMYDSDNWSRYVLDTPMEREPGKKWVYCSGASFLLGVIIHQVSNYTVASFARKFLFDPIGVGNVRWETAPGGYYQVQGGLYITSRDLARLGYLMLNNGTWDGKVIVSSGWVSESTRTWLRQSSTNPDVSSVLGYGYQWWTYPTLRTYFASGYGGQHIFVVPHLDLVVVFTADSYHDGPDPSFVVLPGYVYASVLSDSPLPEKTQPGDQQPGPDITVISCVIIIAAALLLDVCLVMKRARRKR